MLNTLDFFSTFKLTFFQTSRVICPLAPLGQSINPWPAGAIADPLHSLTVHHPAPNAWFTLPLLQLRWCSHY